MHKLLLVLLTAFMSNPLHAGISEGKAAYEAGNYSAAFKEFQKDSKDPVAMAWLGLLYERGAGVKKDPKAAALWMEKAAKGGNDWAQNALSNYLETGQGVKKDYQQAFEWRKKAFDAGNIDAIAELGRMYQHGIGVQIDTEKALELFRQGVEKDDAFAKLKLGRELLLGEIVPKDYVKGKELLQAAYDRAGYVAAAYLLGALWQDGLGGSRDLKKAMEFYRVAADAGDPAAQHNLGSMYARGEGVAVDTSQAMSWYKKAAANGFAKSKEAAQKLQLAIEERQQREVKLAADLEKAQSAKRQLGTMLCSSGSGTMQEYTGYVVLGKPQFRAIQGYTRVSAYVEGSSPPMLSLRVARLQFTHQEGQTVNMDSFDSEWGQLAPGRVFWSNESRWRLC